MELKEFSDYLTRPLERFEDIQKDNFKKIYTIVNSAKEPYNKEHELEVIGFLSPHTRAYTKHIAELQSQGYSLFFLFNLPLRKTNQVIECLIPEPLATKFKIHNTHNVCIRFKKFKKILVEHKGIEDYVSRFAVALIGDFEIINPVKLRTVTSRESREAQKIREELMFDELHIETPSYVKLAIHNSLFLSPKLKSRSGIETKSLIRNSIRGRALINLDSQNKIMADLIPPEISNCHFSHYRTDVISYPINSLGENFDVYIKFPINGYYFNAAYTPNQREDENVNWRNLTNNEIGINHQTKFFNYLTKKEIVDKFISTEFFYNHEYLPEYKIIETRRSYNILDDKRELLYEDYVSRIYKPLPQPSFSVSEEHKIQALARDYADEVGWKIKQGNDSYFNNIVRSINENLYRVKSILNRSGFLSVNLGLEYIQSLQSNFDEIKELSDYKSLPKQEINVEKVTKIMNNVIRANIINALKIRGNNALEDEIFNDFVGLGHSAADIVKEMVNLERGGIIYKVGSIYYLRDKDI